MTTEIRVINGDLVRQLLDMESCIQAMRHAFSLVSNGLTEQPIRTALSLPERALLGLMPGLIREPASLGIKIVSVFPGNFDRGQPTHQGMVMMFDAKDGRPTALLDAHAVTAIRTAAASAVATEMLARRDSTHLALLGYGDQAVTHIEAIRHVRPIARISVWGRDPERAHSFAANHGADPAASVREAIEGADIICCLTASADPVLFGADLEPGQHINAVGASIPSMAELDDEAVRRSRFFVDYRASAEALAGEYRHALASSAIGPDHLLGEIGEVIEGRIAGRRKDSDITCFKSLGMAVEDLVSAQLILARAKERDLGVVVDL